MMIAPYLIHAIRMLVRIHIPTLPLFLYPYGKCIIYGAMDAYCMS